MAGVAAPVNRRRKDRVRTATAEPAAIGELNAALATLTLRDEARLRPRVQRLQRLVRDDDSREPERTQALERLQGEILAAQTRVTRRAAALPAITYPGSLPISAHVDELRAAVDAHQVVVVAGETGSGKTTQLPKICLGLGRGIRGTIVHTQPRRIAARTVAQRLADELGVPLGEAIGFAVRFNDRSDERTLVRLVTDGLLLAEIRRDPLLRRYDTVIVDEAHERSLNIDFLLGYLTRLLPRRPDLKCIITSATIDPVRLAAHFGDAPVVEVSGRAYAVELRYRPLRGETSSAREPADRDQPSAIGDAVEELAREGPGDVLVFCSGEREIRDAADLLRGRLGSTVEILPLYSRLSTAEQQRVFASHSGRRVVLATNVAETSLTVPGIRYVVDAGTARISRYSARLGVQRLPIEPISQASADQRKGRCGRTSEGICIRLYSEEDYLSRARFTEPEVLRTSLASVILQMAALGLGAIEDFPFLDAPDRRRIRDGVSLLHELGALREPDASGPVALTTLGRRLARLPVDPRLARMVVEADRLGCVEEVIVIAAALSIQDPRERPADRREAADAHHRRFADGGSDFLAWLALWRHVREQQRALSASAFRRRCREEFLHSLRIREWQDLVEQLRDAARHAGLTPNEQPAAAERIHRAVLSGLLSHIGRRAASGREYEGARGLRFAPAPDSALSAARPAWAMVAELVHTSRLWGRHGAAIQPAWAQALAGHLVTREHDAPVWERSKAAALARERVSLYGLTLTERRVAYDRIDRVRARELFLRHALVSGEWDADHAFLADNRRLVAEVRALEERTRRRDILVDDDALRRFYDDRVPAEIASGTQFERWWREESPRHPRRLHFTRELLQRADVAAPDDRDLPHTWVQDGLELELSYRFEPGHERDGVTVHVPLARLNAITPAGFEWLVPGLRAELLTALIRTLPKELRRPLVPVPALVSELLAHLQPGSEPLLVALGGEIERLRGVSVPPDAWDPGRLPAHLRVGFVVEDERGAPLARGSDLAALRDGLAPALRERLAAASADLRRRGMHGWELGSLPRSVALPGSDGSVLGYPALIDEGASVGVAVLESPSGQQAAMRIGTRRLLALTIASPRRSLEGRLDSADQLTLAGAPHENVDAVWRDVIAAALDALVAAAGGPAWDDRAFAALHARVAAGLTDAAATVLADLLAVLRARADVLRAMEASAMRGPALEPTRLDLAEQIGGLVFAGFLTASGAERLRDVERYLQAALRRLSRLPAGVARDRDRMQSVRELEARYRELRGALPAGAPRPESLRELPWLLQELRVHCFAEGLTRGAPVTTRRVRRALDDATVR